MYRRFKWIVLAALLLAASRGALAQGGPAYVEFREQVRRGGTDYRADDNRILQLLRGESREGTEPYFGDGKYYREYFPNLGRAALLFRESASLQGRARDEKLDTAISHAGRSLIEKPSFASIWLMSQLYRERGDAASLNSLRGLLLGGPIVFGDGAWKSTGVKPPKLEGTIPLSSGKLKGSYSYDAASGRVSVKLDSRLLSDFNAALIGSLESGDLQVLGIRNAPFIGTPNGVGPAMSSRLLVAEATSAWTTLLNSFDSAINRLVLELKEESGKVLADSRPLVAGLLQVGGKLETGELLEWSLRDGTGEQAKIIRDLSGKGALVSLNWDTLYEADGDVDRFLHYRYKSAGGEVKSGSPLGVRVRVKNPDVDLKFDVKQAASFPDRKIEAVISVNRPLENNSIIQLRHPALEGGQAVIQLGMPKLSGTGTGRRWEYRGSYALKAGSSVQGSVEAEGSFVPAGADKPLKLTRSAAISASAVVALVLPRVKTPPSLSDGPFVVQAAGSAELPDAGLDLLLRRSDGKEEIYKPGDAGDPRRRAFAVPIDENYPLGVYEVVLRFEGKAVQTQAFEVSRRLVRLLEVKALGSSVLRPGEKGKIEFKLDGPLKDDLVATVLLDGVRLISERCKRGEVVNSWLVEVTPAKAGKLTFDFEKAVSLDGTPLLRDARAPLSLECRKEGPRFLLAQKLQSGKLGVGVHSISIEQEAGLAAPAVRLFRTPLGGQRDEGSELRAAKQAEQYEVQVEVKPGENALLTLEAAAGGITATQDLTADGTPPVVEVPNPPGQGDAGKPISLNIRVTGGIAPGSRPDVSLVVNGKTVQSPSRSTDEADRFESSIDLDPEGGDGKIVVTARDEAGNIGRQEIPIRIVGKGAVVAPEKRFAIIVGQQDYASLRDLDGAHDSASRLADTLLKSGYRSDRIFVVLDSKPRSTLKFAVEPRVARSARELRDAIQGIAREMQAGKASHGVFAYVGHGAWMRQNQHILAADFKDGSGYSQGAGDDLDAATTAGCLSIQNVVDLICPPGDNSVHRLLIILDACRDQTGLADQQGKTRAQIRADIDGRTVVVSSVAERETANMIVHPSAGFRGAVFTEVLCRMLSAGGSQGNWGFFRQSLLERLRTTLDTLRSLIGPDVKPQNPTLASDPGDALSDGVREFFDRPAMSVSGLSAPAAR